LRRRDSTAPVRGWSARKRIEQWCPQESVWPSRPPKSWPGLYRLPWREPAQHDTGRLGRWKARALPPHAALLERHCQKTLRLWPLPLRTRQLVPFLPPAARTRLPADTALAISSTPPHTPPCRRQSEATCSVPPVSLLTSPAAAPLQPRHRG